MRFYRWLSDLEGDTFIEKVIDLTRVVATDSSDN